MATGGKYDQIHEERHRRLVTIDDPPPQLDVAPIGARLLSSAGAINILAPTELEPKLRNYEVQEGLYVLVDSNPSYDFKVPICRRTASIVSMTSIANSKGWSGESKRPSAICCATATASQARPSLNFRPVSSTNGIRT